MTQTQINLIIDKIINLGGNKDELELWKALFPTLPPDKQKDLEDNLTQELKELEAVEEQKNKP